MDLAGNMYIADQNNHSIREVTAGIISTISPANISYIPMGIALDTAGRVYFSDSSYPNTVKLLTPVAAFCSYSVATAPAQPTSGSTLNLTVTTTPGCNWNASSDLPWATTSSTGTGTGTASITIASSGGTTRSGTIYIAGQPVLITQSTTPVHSIRDVRGTGVSDTVLYDPILGQEYTALTNGTGGFTYVPNLYTPGFDTLRFADYNGDGKADLVVYKSTTGLAYIGAGDGAGHFTFQSLFWSPGYDRIVSGDLNGDGKRISYCTVPPTAPCIRRSATATVLSVQIYAGQQRLQRLCRGF